MRLIGWKKWGKKSETFPSPTFNAVWSNNDIYFTFSLISFLSTCICACVICSHAYVHLSMSSGLQGIRTASYVMSLSHSLYSLSFTLIPVIHTVAVPVTPSFPSRPALSSLLAKFHTTCPKQRRFTDYHPFDAKRITRAGSFAQMCRHTSAQQGMQCHAGWPCVSSSCRVFPVRLVGGREWSVAKVHPQEAGQREQGAGWAHGYRL